MTLDLKIEKQFKQYLVIKARRESGIQYLFRFENDYGASVIKTEFSFGNKQDLWELALLFWHDGCYELSYHEIVKNGVLGYLSDYDVNKLLKTIYDGKIDEPINWE